MTWHLAEDSDGDETLWYGDTAILREFELESHGLRRAGLRIDLLWSVLTRVLAPDEDTVERLARVVHDADCQCGHRIHDRTGYALHHKEIARAVLAALAAAPDPDGGQDEGVSGS